MSFRCEVVYMAVVKGPEQIGIVRGPIVLIRVPGTSSPRSVKVGEVVEGTSRRRT